MRLNKEPRDTLDLPVPVTIPRRIPLGATVVDGLPFRLWCVMSMLDKVGAVREHRLTCKAFVNHADKFRCVDMFAGRARISKAMAEHSIPTATLDLERDSRDESCRNHFFFVF